MPRDERVGETIPGTDRYIGWWAPRVVGDGPTYPVHMISIMEGVLYRYPHEEGSTEEYIRGEDMEVSEEETTDNGRVVKKV